jgi:YggT family protein
VRGLVCAFLTVYIVVLLLRVLLSWFPIRPGSPVASFAVLVRDLTEPVLAPLRRVIPPLGMLDLSPIIVFIGLGIVQSAICR